MEKTNHSVNYKHWCKMLWDWVQIFFSRLFNTKCLSTSCGGTSSVMVRRSTFWYDSIQGNTKNSPAKIIHDKESQSFRKHNKPFVKSNLRQYQIHTTILCHFGRVKIIGLTNLKCSHIDKYFIWHEPTRYVILR